MIVQFHQRGPANPDIKTGCYVFPDLGSPTHSPRHAVAGPFETAYAARLWILQHLESELSAPQRDVWVKMAARIGGITHDLGLELFLLEHIAKGKSYEQLCRYVPARGADRRQQVDRRVAASGERGEAA